VGRLSIFTRCVHSVINRHPNMWTLIGIGTGAAYLYSVAATLAPEAFPASFRTGGHVAVYFEAAAVIISLTLMGQVLELKARSETGAAIRALLGLARKRRAASMRRGTRRTFARPCPSRRPVAGSAWREGAGRRRGGRREQRDRRVDVDREPMPVGKSAGDALIGATLIPAGH